MRVCGCVGVIIFVCPYIINEIGNRDTNLALPKVQLTSSHTSPQPLNTLLAIPRTNSYVFSDSDGQSKFSDAISLRSLTSIGMGSTDGRKMIIRRVPNSPAELLSIVNPPV